MLEQLDTYFQLHLSHYLSPTVSGSIFSPPLILSVLFSSSLSVCLCLCLPIFYAFLFISPSSFSLCPNFTVLYSALPSTHTNTHTQPLQNLHIVLQYLLAELLLPAAAVFLHPFFLTTINCKERKLLFEWMLYCWYVLLYILCVNWLKELYVGIKEIWRVLYLFSLFA